MPIGLDAVQYAATNARVRGLYSVLLDDSAWDALLASADLPGAMAALQSTPYGETTRQAQDSGDASLEQIERRMWGKAAANVHKTMALVGGQVRALLLVWWQHFELENLKALFRGF
jgi:vacuolar-type H+-ATPase subunit C/Vma6